DARARRGRGGGKTRLELTLAGLDRQRLFAGERARRHRADAVGVLRCQVATVTGKKLRPARISSANHSAKPFLMTHSNRSLPHCTREGSKAGRRASWRRCSGSITSALSRATAGRSCTRSSQRVSPGCLAGSSGKPRKAAAMLGGRPLERQHQGTRKGQVVEAGKARLDCRRGVVAYIGTEEPIPGRKDGSEVAVPVGAELRVMPPVQRGRDADAPDRPLEA